MLTRHSGSHNSKLRNVARSLRECDTIKCINFVLDIGTVVDLRGSLRWTAPEPPEVVVMETMLTSLPRNLEQVHVTFDFAAKAYGRKMAEVASIDWHTVELHLSQLPDSFREMTLTICSPAHTPKRSAWTPGCRRTVLPAFTAYFTQMCACFVLTLACVTNELCRWVTARLSRGRVCYPCSTDECLMCPGGLMISVLARRERFLDFNMY